MDGEIGLCYRYNYYFGLLYASSPELNSKNYISWKVFEIRIKFLKESSCMMGYENIGSRGNNNNC